MSRIFITGSSDGLGVIAARALIDQGHTVTLHARNAQRAKDALSQIPGAAGCLVGDLSSISSTKNLAAEANKSGKFDVVMHNAGLGYKEQWRETSDGLGSVFAVNSLAPYMLTCLMERPKRLVYLSSGLHRGGKVDFGDITWTGRDVFADGEDDDVDDDRTKINKRRRRWDPLQGYSDSKLQDVILAYAVARRWGDKIESVACSPGWVRTKMGGMTAPGDAETGARTQIMLAASSTPLENGTYWVGGKMETPHGQAGNADKQEEYLKICERVSGVKFPNA